MPGGRKAYTPEQMLEFLRTNVRRDPDSDCLNWAGTFWVQPVVTWHRKQLLARRTLAKLSGLLPENASQRRMVYVICENERCMNEAHFRIGDHKQIAKNMKARGRSFKTADHALRTTIALSKTAKLPITERANVMRMLGEGMSYAQIGEIYGCSKSNVHLRVKKWNRLLGGFDLSTTRSAETTTKDGC